ncbi:MAG: DNA-binding protein WhiA [Eubacteriales bacterium]|jgi:DNA-binding protein WhiA|nr:DNA-binding protein WhiA [Eubacteriales bacterium]
MSFASKVKNEVSKLELEEICCTRSELVGIICFGAQIFGDIIKINTEHECVAMRMCTLLERLYNYKTEPAKSPSGIYTVAVCGADALKFLRDMRLASVPIRLDDEIIRRPCCKSAVARGAFLGSGSVSDPEKGYHLELVTGYYTLCKDFANILEYFGVGSKFINRKGNYVFYIKDSQQIQDFLAAIGAHSQMMEFVNVKIEKEVRNATNRLVNCETANAGKTAEAAVIQAMAIRHIDSKIGLESLPPQLVEVARLRLENAEASMGELAAKIGMTKSGVNHRMRKILKIAKELT